jgi:hypothetical protein
MNQGEIAEFKFIATLCSLRGQSLKLWSNQQSIITIKDVEIPKGTELYSVVELPIYITPEFISKQTDEEILKLCNKYKITKAGAKSKADIFINSVGYSIKYNRAAAPALVNHTARHGWEIAAMHKGINIGSLDPLIADYWMKRKAGVIKEDVTNLDTNSPFAKYKNILTPFLEYFAFEGTGSGISNHPATAYIDIGDPCNPSTWSYLSKTTLINDIWDQLRFSIRSKATPQDFGKSKLRDSEKASIKYWTEKADGKLKGSLHIRINR